MLRKALDLFQPLIGQYMWSAYRTHGSCMFLEFGRPHLWIREPKPSSSVPLLRDRRRVKPQGEWSLLIEFCDYVIEAGGARMTEADTDAGVIEACLKHLEGQKLASVLPGPVGYSIVLAFDLGGRAVLQPTSDPYFKSDDHQWMLSMPDGHHISFSNGGALEAEAPEPH